MLLLVCDLNLKRCETLAPFSPLHYWRLPYSAGGHFLWWRICQTLGRSGNACNLSNTSINSTRSSKGWISQPTMHGRSLISQSSSSNNEKNDQTLVVNNCMESYQPRWLGRQFPVASPEADVTAILIPNKLRACYFECVLRMHSTVLLSWKERPTLPFALHHVIMIWRMGGTT